MKVTCKACGKRFDYKIYSGMCPKCNTYYGLIGEKEEKSTVKQKENKQKGKHSRAYHVATVVLVGLIFLAMVISEKAKVWFNEEGMERKTVKTPIKVKEIKVNEPFIYIGNEFTYKVTITGAKVDQDKDLLIQKDYEMVVVSYKIDSDTKEANLPYYREIHMEPYLITKEGDYLTSVNKNDVDDGKGYDYDESEKAGISNRFENKEGVIYYLVKKDDTAGMLISSFDFDQEDYCNTSLRDTFFIKHMEVER